ncbi:MAG: hypothetical protein ACXVCE_13890 [Bacteriovorax sp.]
MENLSTTITGILSEKGFWIYPTKNFLFGDVLRPLYFEGLDVHNIILAVNLIEQRIYILQYLDHLSVNIRDLKKSIVLANPELRLFLDTKFKKDCASELYDYLRACQLTGKAMGVKVGLILKSLSGCEEKRMRIVFEERNQFFIGPNDFREYLDRNNKLRAISA